MYCEGNGLVEPTGPCNEGYYCEGGSYTKTPSEIYVNGSYNDICPEGYYCPRGSTTSIPCPMGTYNARLGFAGYQGDNESYVCDPCPATFACNGTALRSWTSKCDEGYFCKQGSPSPKPNCMEAWCIEDFGLCPVGYYCEQGTDEPALCGVGTYGNVTGQASCLPCPAGYYCDGT